MRLLDKQSVAAQVNSQKQSQIEEGIQVAKKVDAVRSALSVEEVKLKEFRANAIAVVQKEIDSKVLEKAELDAEIDNARANLKTLRVPLDAEWKKLAEDKEALRLREIDIVSREYDAETRENVNQITATQVNVALEEAERASNKAKLASQKASDDRIEADRVLQSARNQAMKIIQEAENIRLEAKNNFDAVSVKERDVKIKHSHQEDRQKEQAEREIQLNDRSATLERAFKRIKK